MPILAERMGEAEVAGVTLYGKVDRIDRLPDGKLAIVDYKTGQAPRPKAVAEGFALQLGLLSLIARDGGFGDIRGEAGAHEYWSLAKKNGRIRLSLVTRRRRGTGASSSIAPMPISPTRRPNGCSATSRSRPSSTRPMRPMRIMTS